MTHRELEDVDELRPSDAEIHVTAASFYYVLVKNGYGEEATEFAEWFLDHLDLES
jgi:hypothetical protein